MENQKKVYTAQSTRRIEEAAEELYLSLNVDGGIDNGNIKLLIFFVSSMYNASLVNSMLNSRFNGIPLIGCSTSGELSSGHLGSGGIVVMGLTDAVVEDMHLEVVEGLDGDLPAFSPIMHRFSEHFGEAVSQMDMNKYFGLLLIDGLSNKEELFLENFGDFTNIRFTGGSAGDDAKFNETTLFANGRIYKRAGLILIIKSGCSFGVEKIQSFKPIGKMLTVTKSDEDNRIIYELNGKPANVAYCEALGISASESSNRLIVNPLGLMIGQSEPFVRSTAKVLDDGSFKMYCSVKEGMDLEILRNTDILQDTEEFLERLQNKYGSISGLLSFNCILRYIELQLLDKVDAFGELFSDIPTIGFCTYGEYYIGFVNQTLTTLVLI